MRSLSPTICASRRVCLRPVFPDRFVAVTRGDHPCRPSR
jgi:hypothetical protein